MNRRTVALTRLHQAGGLMYSDKPLTQLDHALQCAWLAESAGASDALVIAALLHDIGHVLRPGSDSSARRGVDLSHQEVGARFLEWSGFPPAVCEPVRLHVLAKRLLARDVAFVDRLSDESVLNLNLQGGPLTNDEASDFRRNPFAPDALRLREWDDLATETGLLLPDLMYWAPRVQAVGLAPHLQVPEVDTLSVSP